VSLAPLSEFHSIAFPSKEITAPAPWSGQGPRLGALYGEDALLLARLLRGFTRAPEYCWFCLWAGYDLQGWLLTAPGVVSVRRPDPLPPTVRNGPRVCLPGRDYLLYTGPVEAVVAPGQLSLGQTANLWWPQDRAWCVASEIDLAWTYVGGTKELVDALVSHPDIEAFAVDPEGPVSRVEPFISRWVNDAVERLITDGEALIDTSRGTVQAWLRRPSCSAMAHCGRLTEVPTTCMAAAARSSGARATKSYAAR
jgi:hypothetical protein